MVTEFSSPWFLNVRSKQRKKLLNKGSFTSLFLIFHHLPANLAENLSPVLSFTSCQPTWLRIFHQFYLSPLASQLGWESFTSFIFHHLPANLAENLSPTYLSPPASQFGWESFTNLSFATCQPIWLRIFHQLVFSVDLSSHFILHNSYIRTTHLHNKFLVNSLTVFTCLLLSTSIHVHHRVKWLHPLLKHMHEKAKRVINMISTSFIFGLYLSSMPYSKCQ